MINLIERINKLWANLKTEVLNLTYVRKQAFQFTNRCRNMIIFILVCNKISKEPIEFFSWVALSDSSERPGYCKQQCALCLNTAAVSEFIAFELFSHA